MRNGTPSVTTDIGIEGISDTKGWSGAIANTSREIAEKAIELYSNKQVWFSAQQKSNPILAQRFDSEKHFSSFKEQLETAFQNSSINRSNNFIGRMFSHQTMNSSKYFSKWIEEKNKGND